MRYRWAMRWGSAATAALMLLALAIAMPLLRANAKVAQGMPAGASCAVLAAHDQSATNGQQWGRTLLEVMAPQAAGLALTSAATVSIMSRPAAPMSAATASPPTSTRPAAARRRCHQRTASASPSSGRAGPALRCLGLWRPPQQILSIATARPVAGRPSPYRLRPSPERRLPATGPRRHRRLGGDRLEGQSLAHRPAGLARWPHRRGRGRRGQSGHHRRGERALGLA